MFPEFWGFLIVSFALLWPVILLAQHHLIAALILQVIWLGLVPAGIWMHRLGLKRPPLSQEEIDRITGARPRG